MKKRDNKKYYFEELDENLQERIFENVGERLTTVEEANKFITNQDKMTKKQWVSLSDKLKNKLKKVI